MTGNDAKHPNGRPPAGTAQADGGMTTHVDARRGYTRTVVEDTAPMSGAQFEAGLALLMERIEAVCTHREHEMQKAVKAAIDEALADEAAIKKFWKTGFDELADHSANGASQWIGRRLLTGVAVALLFALLTWLVQSGRLK